MLEQSLSKIDLGNKRVMDSIGKMDPKYAKHMFLSNQIIEQFAMHSGGGLELLDQPVCTQCEKPAAWNDGGSAYCFSCHRTIPADQITTVLEYLRNEIKTFDVEKLEILNRLGGLK